MKIDQVTEQDLQLAALMSTELEAAILFAEGHREGALQRAAKAVAMADTLPTRTEPPSVPKPARELMGEILLAAGRFEEAREQFEAALKRTPGRTRTLIGLLESLERTGKADRAALIRSELRRQWRGEWPVSQTR